VVGCKLLLGVWQLGMRFIHPSHDLHAGHIRWVTAGGNEWRELLTGRIHSQPVTILRLEAEEDLFDERLLHQ
jgi:hypothetical protein